MANPTGIMEAHEVLGVSIDATEEQVRAAYKILAMKWHPDRQLNNREEATSKFIEINKANRTMHRIIRRARRAAAEAASNAPVSNSLPASPKPTSTPLASSSKASKHTANSQNSSPNYSPSTSRTPSSSSRDTASTSSPPSSFECADDLFGRPDSPSARSSGASSAEPSSKSASSSTKSPRTKLRKQSRPKACRPNPTTTDDFTPKSFPWRETDDSSFFQYDPERVPEGTLCPERSILRAAGADVPKTWQHTLNMSLEEIYMGKTFHFRLVRYRLSGKKCVVPLEVTVPPGCREGTEVILRGVGNERKDGTRQDIIFLVKESKHERFQRVHDDLILDVRLPWVDSLNKKEGEVHFTGVDGKDHMFRINYCANRILSGGAIIPGAGMPCRSGDRKGRIIIRWEISSPASSWESIKQVLKFKC
ncbi:hypothetical protein B0H34DRAFT_173015 [Crassisporium funariophilum]|nr:hypothetical protein B0H34DRAFT_173015 [Crassisporium funariophilum]